MERRTCVAIRQCWLSAAVALATLAGGCSTIHEVDGRNVFIEHARSESIETITSVQIKASIACGKNEREPIFVHRHCAHGPTCTSYFRCH
jgi:hypothetical protein